MAIIVTVQLHYKKIRAFEMPKNDKRYQASVNLMLCLEESSFSSPLQELLCKTFASFY